MVDMVDTKLEKLMDLVEIMEYDSTTKTLTINSDINIKVKGNYLVDCDKHISMNSNVAKEDPVLKIPYSVFINSDDPKIQNILAQIKHLL